jgi:hypothetical protein
MIVDRRGVGVTKIVTWTSAYSLLLIALVGVTVGALITPLEPGQAQHVVKEHIMGADIQAMGPQASGLSSGPTVPVHPSSVRHTDLRVSQVHEIAAAAG